MSNRKKIKKKEETVGIKPCPFCNNSNPKKYSLQTAGSLHQILCSACGAFGPAAESEDEALDVWNNRFVSIVSEEQYKALMEEVDGKED